MEVQVLKGCLRLIETPIDTLEICIYVVACLAHQQHQRDAEVNTAQRLTYVEIVCYGLRSVALFYLYIPPRHSDKTRRLIDKMVIRVGFRYEEGSALSKTSPAR